MQPIQLIIVSFLGGLLVGVGAAGIASWLVSRQQAQRNQDVLASSQAEAADRERRYSDEIHRLRSEHRAEVRELESAGLGAFERKRRQQWFQAMRAAPWDRGTPEVEVEAKFVFQWLQFLGYDEEDIRLRPDVSAQEGSKPVTLEADWLVRDEQDRPVLVIEVKAPSVPLGESVREQARSYAFRLSAPAYAITNGQDLQIYHLGVVQDTCVVACSVSELAENWEQIEQVASKASLTALRSQLGH